MKYTTISLLCFASLTLCVQSCDLFDKADKKDELPPATQEGRNTFGCLVNGRVWLPEGKTGPTSNLDASYDPYFEGGSFDVGAYKITDGVDQFMSFGGKNINTVGDYNFTQDINSSGAFLSDKKTKCSYDEQANVVSGKFIITKLDISNQIISGSFDFTLYKSGCDTIKVTQGRFDMKF